MDEDSPIETTRSKRKASEKAPTAEQEEPRKFISAIAIVI